MTRTVLVLAPFFVGSDRTWIDDFCRRSDLEFQKPAYRDKPESWHTRGATTPIMEWLNYARYAYGSMAKAHDCVITSFPQLALIAAALLLAKNRRTTKLIAWNFNLGSLPDGYKRRLGGKILRRVDRFIVHARGEIPNYARWLDLPEEKFLFVPLQRGAIAPLDPSPIKKPYIVSMGSANRDYLTLLEAVLGTGITTVVISKKDILDSLPEHPDLIKLHSLSMKECDDILGEAAINVVPIASTETAAGQVTFTTSMRMGIATIASRCIGSVDYIRDGETGMLVPVGDPDALRTAINSLWDDSNLRSRIAVAGREYADQYLSDEAAGRYLAQAIDGLFDSAKQDFASS